MISISKLYNFRSENVGLPHPAQDNKQFCMFSASVSVLLEINCCFARQDSAVNIVDVFGTNTCFS
jgi:hypothetical protein